VVIRGVFKISFTSASLKEQRKEQRKERKKSNITKARNEAIKKEDKQAKKKKGHFKRQFGCMHLGHLSLG
jgi:hypothetical protein